MEVVADAVLQQHGHVIGVIPAALVNKEVAHRGLSELRVVQSMHERKAIMAELSHGFIAMPGGIGTMEEFFEVLSWAQLGLHNKPCGLLNVCGYYRALVDFMDYAVEQGFLKPKHRALLIVEEQAGALLDRLQELIVAHAPEPFDPSQT
jgi:uncharacterized protein (TIGR00730 family)